VTSATPMREHRILNVAVCGRGALAWAAGVSRRARAPNGTGDAFGALLLGYRLAGATWPRALARATAAIDAVLDASIGRDEMALAPALAHLRDVGAASLEELG
jgi:pyridoxal/pyridoxine/pyridoxamine kinase